MNTFDRLRRLCFLRQTAVAVMLIFIGLFAVHSPRIFAQSNDWTTSYPQGRQATDQTGNVNKSSYIFSASLDNHERHYRTNFGAVEGVTVPEGTYKNDPNMQNG